jgi:hypothetical protein
MGLLLLRGLGANAPVIATRATTPSSIKPLGTARQKQQQLLLFDPSHDTTSSIARRNQCRDDDDDDVHPRVRRCIEATILLYLLLIHLLAIDFVGCANRQMQKDEPALVDKRGLTFHRL